MNSNEIPQTSSSENSEIIGSTPIGCTTLRLNTINCLHRFAATKKN